MSIINKIVIGLMLLLMIVSVVFCAFSVYMLIAFWETKVMIGTVSTSIYMTFIGVLFGIGVPAVIIHVLRR